MKQEETDKMYMRRCLQLAANGRQNARPNPMVGAVIVSADGRIIGEGYHQRCGEGHAEVNAFASVRPEDEHLLKDSTIYVSLEPCAHYGKTPPCCDLVISKGVRRCVCGCRDSFEKVDGKGIQRMREAGIEVTVGVLEKECRELNKFFFTYYREHRPYILLKWAQSADKFIAAEGGKPFAFSTPFTKMLVHKLRSEYDAITVGHNTLRIDHPSLNVRDWSGRNPLPVVIGRDISDEELSDGFRSCPSIEELLQQLYEEQCQSLMVEGGLHLLSAFVDAGLWDEIRIETAPVLLGEGVFSPILPPNIQIKTVEHYGGNTIITYKKSNTES